MQNDVFLPENPVFIVYGLFDEQEPLHLRYIGQTITPAVTRLTGHLTQLNFNLKKQKWIEEVANKGSKIGLRILGEYPLVPLLEREIIERKWINFWGNYCDLLNGIPDFKKMSAKGKRHKKSN